MCVKLTEVKLRTLVKCKLHVVSVCRVGGDEAYCFETREYPERTVILLIHPEGVSAFQVIGNSLFEIRNPRDTVKMLRDMGFTFNLLPSPVRKALALQAIL